MFSRDIKRLVANYTSVTLVRISGFLFLVLVAILPFELRFNAFGLSNLQWLFAVTAMIAVPALLGQWKELVRERLVIAAGVLTLVYWVSAMLAEEFTPNATKAAVRMTAALVLLCIALASRRPQTIAFVVVCVCRSGGGLRYRRPPRVRCSTAFSDGGVLVG